MKAVCGGDANTGVITQPYRVAGTPNYPGAKKRAGGRTVVTTHVVKSGGPVWTREQLFAAFPPLPQTQASVPTGRTGIVDGGVEAMVAERGNDRSGRVFDAVKTARAAGMTPDDLEDLMRRHPEGCAAKYLAPTDRLHKEIERAWNKLKDRGAAEPTYADNAATDAKAGRAQLKRLIGTTLTAEGPVVDALAASTGIGKTRLAAGVIAEHPVEQTNVYTVPTHKLGEDIADQFRGYGLTAEVYRSRERNDKDGKPMCDDLEAVELAHRAGQNIGAACCKGKTPGGKEARCPHYDSCGYQRQKRQTPDVWLAAHQMLFHEQAAFGDVDRLIVDESFWQAGTYGNDPERHGLTLDEIERLPLTWRLPPHSNHIAINCCAPYGLRKTAE